MRTAMLFLLLLPPLLPAQVHLTVRSGFVAHGAHASDGTSADAPTFRPGTGGELAVAVGLDLGGWRIATTVRRAPADLVLRGGDAGIITPDALRATGIALELGRRLAGTAERPALHALLGAERINWSFPGLDEPTRSGWGGLVALEGSVPFGRRVAGVVRLEAARGGSLFSPEELPEGFRRQAASRVGLALGIRARR